MDVPSAVTVLNGGLAGSAVLQRKAQAMQDRNFTPGFRIALHHKDMSIVTSAARERSVVIPLGAVVAQLIAALNAQGDGGPRPLKSVQARHSVVRTQLTDDELSDGHHFRSGDETA